MLTLLRWAQTTCKHSTPMYHTHKFTAPKGNQTAAGSANVGQLTDGSPTSNNVYGHTRSSREGQTHTYRYIHIELKKQLFWYSWRIWHKNVSNNTAFVTLNEHIHIVNNEDDDEVGQGLRPLWLEPDWCVQTQQLQGFSHEFQPHFSIFISILVSQRLSVHPCKKAQSLFLCPPRTFAYANPNKTLNNPQLYK